MSSAVESSTLMDKSWLNESWQEDLDDLMEEADTALASSPNPINLSRYLSTKDISRALETTAETPITLSSLQPGVARSLDKSTAQSVSKLNVSNEVADFLDYLNNIRFDQTTVPQFQVGLERDNSTRCPDLSKIKQTKNVCASSRQQEVDVSTQQTPGPRIQELPRIVLRNQTNISNFQNQRSTKESDDMYLSSLYPNKTATKTPGAKRLPPSPDGVSEIPRRTVSEERPSPDANNSMYRGLNGCMSDSMETNNIEKPIKMKQISEGGWCRLQALELKLEIALNDVYTERQSTRDWAQAMQKSVQKWVKEQRALIDLERKHAAEFILTKEQKDIQQKECTLMKLERDLNSATSKHQAVEQNLQEIIHCQAEKIRVLMSRLENKPSLRPSPTGSLHSIHAGGTILTTQLSPPATELSAPSEQLRQQRLDPPCSGTPFLSEPESQLFVSPGTQCRKGRDLTTTKHGNRILTYRNGTKKEIRSDGSSIITYVNGDTKTDDGLVISYYHAADKTTHSKHPNGLQVYEYHNRQVERHYPDGHKEVLYQNGVSRRVHPDGTKETTFTDGIRVVEHSNGYKEIIRI